MEFATAKNLIAYVKDTKLAAMLDRNGITSLELDARVEVALAAANDEVGSYVRMQNTLPLKTIPAKLTQCAVILTLRGLGISVGYKLSELDGQMKDEAIEYLEKVAKHEVNLQFESREERNQIAAPLVVTDSAANKNKIFGETWPYDYSSNAAD
jgi:phage gp36-like protein